MNHGQIFDRRFLKKPQKRGWLAQSFSHALDDEMAVKNNKKSTHPYAKGPYNGATYVP